MEVLIGVALVVLCVWGFLRCDECSDVRSHLTLAKRAVQDSNGELPDKVRAAARERARIELNLARVILGNSNLKPSKRKELEHDLANIEELL